MILRHDNDTGESRGHCEECGKVRWLDRYGVCDECALLFNAEEDEIDAPD